MSHDVTPGAHSPESIHAAHLQEEERLHVEHMQEEKALQTLHDHEEEELREAHRQEESCAALVVIIVGDEKIPLEPGMYLVSAIKKKAKVDDAYQLTQIVNCRDEPLADDQEICIRGGEEFECHPPHGGSS